MRSTLNNLHEAVGNNIASPGICANWLTTELTLLATAQGSRNGFVVLFVLAVQLLVLFSVVKKE